MSAAAQTLALLDWKRRVFDLYAGVRTMPPEQGWTLWRETRDELFRSHPQSPRPGYDGLAYYDYDPDARVLAELEEVEAAAHALETSGPEPMLFKPVARAHFTLRGEQLALELEWLESYGGGLFLSFCDATSGHETYGGGRYLLDTVKGADLGEDGGGRLVLDFNFAYNPSCAYDSSWVCPLAPPANRLSVAVEAGERHTG
jgi:uncharacterized protein